MTQSTSVRGRPPFQPLLLINKCAARVIDQAARALAAEDALRRWPPQAAIEAAKGAGKRKSDEWSVPHEEDVI